MPPLNQSALLRARHALYWARHYQSDVVDHDPVLSERVRKLVAPWTIRLHDLPATAFPVTTDGRQTLAIVPELARQTGAQIVVRGYDETGRAGFLVLDGQHGLSPNPAVSLAAAAAL